MGPQKEKSSLAAPLLGQLRTSLPSSLSVSPVSSKKLPSSPRPPATTASLLSRCCAERCLSSPRQLLSDDTGADGSSDYGGCITLCCCSINSLISRARSYPLTALSVGSRLMCKPSAAACCRFCSCMLRAKELSSTALCLLCPGRLPGSQKDCSSCGYTEGFATTVKNLSFSMIYLLPLYFQYPVSQGEFVCD